MIKIQIIDESNFVVYVIKKLLQDVSDIKVTSNIKSILELYPDAGNKNVNFIIINMNIPLLMGIKSLKTIFDIKKIPVLIVCSNLETIKEMSFPKEIYPYIDYFKINALPNKENEDTIKKELINKIYALYYKIFSEQKPNNYFNNLIDSHEKSELQNNKEPIRKYFSKKVAKIVIAIGSSTGGPRILKEIIAYFSSELQAAILISQHMPHGFTNLFAKQLNSISGFEVVEAQDKMKIYEKTVYICPGNYNMKVHNKKIDLVLSDPENLETPSVNVMFESVAQEYKSNCIAVVLTGMGKDGTEGIEQIKKFGGYLIAQDENSSIIFGMPKSAIDTGLVNKVLPANLIPDFINKKVLKM